ncbi:hypothetical protein AALP_AA7G054300 [Arabis alpina]|uniref:Bifunctional inhibitor/plant lipid transfer protein/seed storage helical domain-containing protein n=1 Tax=Arabis alpina TaxID=50452 RepID=A0A087GG25_ARAAL|nr:hypothetical protein AALP_AA7G054300 [Arabis alpina]
MAYTNKFPAAAVVVTVVLFLMLTIAPRGTEAQQLPSMSKINPLCVFAKIPTTVQLCYLTGNLAPSDECCDDLKSKSKPEVNCLCDNFIVLPANSNFTGTLFDIVHTKCGVADKYACTGRGANGGATNKFAASMGLFGLVANFLF